MMKKKNPKLELESSRKVFFQLGLFIVGSATLMAFSYKIPLNIEEDIVKQNHDIDIPVEMVVKDIEAPIKLPEVKNTKSKTEPSTPIVSDLLLKNIKTVKSTGKEAQLVVTSNDHKNITSGNFDVDPGKAPELGKIVDFPDHDAQFQGDWLAYLGNTLVYPEISITYGDSGTAYVGFVVEVDGTITDVEVKNKSLPKALQKEAIRVVKASPNWKPGIKNGEYVRSTKVVKINFLLK